jgi:hypothetical protein
MPRGRVKVYPHGIGWHTGGTISLYDGTKLKKSAHYYNLERKKELMKQWKNDIKKLKATDQYYFIISPKIEP